MQQPSCVKMNMGTTVTMLMSLKHAKSVPIFMHKGTLVMQQHSRKICEFKNSRKSS